MERLLQLNVATMAALGTLLLGMGEHSVLLPLLALVSAVAAFWLTDVRGSFRLHSHVVNYAALAAVGVAMIEFLNEEYGQHLVAVANLLIYLQIVLLFQKKSLRIYWQLIVLSLLQVVVAAALNLGFLFGVLLIVYMFVMFSALMLFFVHRESIPFTTLRGSGHGRRGGGWGVIDFSHPRPRRRAAEFHARTVEDPAASMLSGSLYRQLGWIGCFTLLLAVGVFFLVPRFGQRVWRGAVPGGGRTAGFSDRVSLNDLGRILENPEIVMRVGFADEETSRPVEVFGEPYFRGIVHVDYTPFQGRWSRRQFLDFDAVQLPEPPRHVPRNRLVRQEILLEPGHEPYLFAAAPSFRVYQTPSIVRWYAETDQLLREPDEGRLKGSQFRYAVGTTAFVNGWQVAHLPCARRTGVRLQYYLLTGQSRDELAVNRESLAGLAALAEQVVTEAGVPAGDSIGRARVLEAHLRNSALYTYSLDLPSRRRATIDPVEEFVTGHRTGHCEYFASALTLMLRSQRIPARMVIGFKGGDYNTVGGYYQVRQLHAHAWVEAYIGPRLVETSGLAERAECPYGAWLRLDPTPGDDDPDMLASNAGLLARVREVSDYTQLLWDDYVLGLNWERQQNAIYLPLWQYLSSAWSMVRSPQAWQDFYASLRRLVAIDAVAWLKGNWFSWRAGVAAMLISGLVMVLYRLVYLPLQIRVARLLARRTRKLHQRRRVDFYERLEHLLARHGLRRAAHQTPREFAAAAGGQLAESYRAIHLAAVPRRLADAYYRVRFGGQQLPARELEGIHRELSQLEDALSGAARS